MEATELIDIAQELADWDNREIASRLQDFVAGATVTSDEQPDKSRARNIGFELTIAAALSAAGIPVDLKPPTDVWVPFSDHPVAIECKRLSSKSQVEKRVREGFKQLSQRYALYSDPRKARGILALSFTKLENPGDLILNPQDEVGLNKTIQRIVDRWIICLQCGELRHCVSPKTNSMRFL